MPERQGDTSEENEGDGETDVSVAFPPVRRDTEAVTPGPPILQTHGATLGRGVSARVCGQGGEVKGGVREREGGREEGRHSSQPHRIAPGPSG